MIDMTLDKDIIAIELTYNQADILMKIIDDEHIACKVIDTTTSMCFLFKNTNIHADNLTACLHTSMTAIVKTGIKNNKVAGTIVRDEEPDELPRFLEIGRNNLHFYNKDDVEQYMSVLRMSGFSKEDVERTSNIICKYMMPRSFSKGKRFLHNKFADYVIERCHIKRIDGALHVYVKERGIYCADDRYIMREMQRMMPTLTKSQRDEVMSYIEIVVDECNAKTDLKHIAFRNCILDITTKEQKQFSPEIILTNRIPWDYDPAAYSELLDKTLDNISCNDREIRSVLEEAIGYCFYRNNKLGKSFVLVGRGSNGKSVYLDLIKTLLSRENYSSLELSQLDNNFATSDISGKLANIGDDISENKVSSSTVSVFKKLVTGEDIMVDRKYKDIMMMASTAKLFFAANTVPEFFTRGLHAIERRLIIIPFDATFSSESDDFDCDLSLKFNDDEVCSYAINLALAGLKRVLANSSFTHSVRVDREMRKFKLSNDTMKQFIEELTDDVDDMKVIDVYQRYVEFTKRHDLKTLALNTFSKEFQRASNFKTKRRVIENKKYTVFTR